MRPALSLKILLRSPFKALLTFILLAAATFALFSRVIGYTVTEREMNRAASFYRGVAVLDPGVPNTLISTGGSMLTDRNDPPALTAAQIEAFSSLPQVTSVERRYMTAGVSDEFMRLDLNSDPSYNYTTRCILEGTFDHASDNLLNPNLTDLLITDCMILAGEIEDGDKTITVYKEDRESVWFSITQPGCRMRSSWFIVDNPFGQSFVDTLTPGERVLMIVRHEPRAPGHFMLGDQDTIDAIPSFWPLDGLPENYLELDEFSPIRRLMEITNNDARTFDMVYTSDMYAIPRFYEQKTAISAGRMLTPEDTGSCVVSEAFLRQNKLEVGDTVTMRLGVKVLEQNAALGAVACIPDRYAPPAETVELTIVGAYLDTDTLGDRLAYVHWNYSPNTMFVPLSLLPAEVPENHLYRPGEVSFVIRNAREIEAFRTAAGPLAEAFGISLLLDDAGWGRVSKNLETGTQASLITTLLFILASAAVGLLAMALLMGRSRQTYAIMRALGAPRGKARNALLFPACILSVLAIPAGCAAGLRYTGLSVAPMIGNIASAVTDAYIPDTSLPVMTTLVCLLCEITFLSLLVLFMLRRLEKTPPLTLLQGNPMMLPELSAAYGGGHGKTDNVVSIAQFAVPFNRPRGRYGAVRHVIRCITRHIRRTYWKAALCVLIAALMCGAMGAFAVTRLVYEDLYNDIEVKGFIKDISSQRVAEPQPPDLIRGFYYQGGFSVVVNDIALPCDLTVTNDVGRCIQKDIPIEYDGGCVLSEGIADRLGVGPGDQVKLLNEEYYNILLSIYTPEHIMAAFGVAYTVTGVIPSDFHAAGERIFIPAGRNAERAYSGSTTARSARFPIERCEFVLADNERADEARDYIESLVSQSRRISGSASYVLDTAELENAAWMIALLKALFPVAVAAAVLIGLSAPGLVIIQSAKEAAIMRILGTTKLRTRCILALEQIGLCVLGFSLAAVGLALYHSGQFFKSADTLMLCGGLYLLGCVCAVILAAASVTRSKGLALLQVKE